MEPKNNLILALYPNIYGIGYVICENPQNIIDYGLKKVRPRTLSHYIAMTQWLFEIARPDIVVIRDYKDDDFKISNRTQRVLDELLNLAKSMNLKIYKYSRSQIRNSFDSFHAKTKYEIAKQLTKWYPQLASRTPEYRKAYMAENYHMAIFDAFALVITHDHLN